MQATLHADYGKRKVESENKIYETTDKNARKPTQRIMNETRKKKNQNKKQTNTVKSLHLT